MSSHYCPVRIDCDAAKGASVHTISIGFFGRRYDLSGREWREPAEAGQCSYLPFFLCLFFLSFFLRLCVEIFFRLRFRPHGTKEHS